MCFGNQQTGEKTTTSTPNPAVAAAATGNLDFATKLRDQGFTPYGGQQVANFSGQQANSFGMTDAAANNGTGAKAGGLIDQYSSAPAQSVGAETIQQNMSPYMSQYLMQALAPQMQQMDIRNAGQDAALNAQATGSGAFGDARTGIEASNQRFNQNVEREGVVGQAYDRAFSQAIGAGSTDASNKLAASNANAGYNESALARALGGAGAMQGLQDQQLGVAGKVNAAGQQQTAQNQAQLTAQYNQWLMAQQYPFQTGQLVNQTVAAGSGAMPATTTATTTAPDNSGLAMGGALMSAFLSDRDLKEDIDEIGVLKDGTKVYSYKYHRDIDPSGRKHIGVMAQENPDAAFDIGGGILAVDYGKVAKRSLLHAFGA